MATDNHSTRSSRVAQIKEQTGISSAVLPSSSKWPVIVRNDRIVSASCMEMVIGSLGIMCASSYAIGCYNCYSVSCDYDAVNRKLYAVVTLSSFLLPQAAVHRGWRVEGGA